MYQDANRLMEEIRTGERHALLLEGVVMETVYVLTKFYGVPKREAAEKLQAILSYKGIENTDKNDLIAALGEFGKKRLDLVDCILKAKSKSKGMELFSFDKQLKKSSKST